MKTLKAFGGLLVEAFKEWKADKASRQAAALSYYTIFSLAPIVVIVITILGWIYRTGDVSSLFMTQVTGLIGDSGGQVFETIIETARQPQSSTWAAIISLATALFGATGVFVQLKDSLNVAWGITEERFSGLKGMVRVRAISLTVTLVIGFLLLVSLFISTALSAVTARLSSDNAVVSMAFQVLNQVIAIGMIAVLFAFIFKFLPDIKIPWKDVWVGAIFTSILFNIGKFLIGFYLGNSNVGSSFGAAGSILVLLVWVYYSAQLILFGAEFTQVYSNRYGSNVLSGTPKTAKHRAKVKEDENGKPVIEVRQDPVNFKDDTPEPEAGPGPDAGPANARARVHQASDTESAIEERRKAEATGRKLGTLAFLGMLAIPVAKTALSRLFRRR